MEAFDLRPQYRLLSFQCASCRLKIVLDDGKRGHSTLRGSKPPPCVRPGGHVVGAWPDVEVNPVYTAFVNAKM